MVMGIPCSLMLEQCPVGNMLAPVAAWDNNSATDWYKRKQAAIKRLQPVLPALSAFGNTYLLRERSHYVLSKASAERFGNHCSSLLWSAGSVFIG